MSEGLICTSCGAKIPSDSDFCPACGKPAARDEGPVKESVGEKGVLSSSGVPVPPAPTHVPTHEAPVSPVAKAKTAKKRKVDVIGWAEGVVIAAAGLYLALMVSGDLDSMAFGGDAYTALYKGLVVISDTLALLARCVGVALAACGVAKAARALFGK